MDAKIFDPLDDAAVNAWLATPPTKEIVAVEIFETSLHGWTRQVALIFYSDTPTLGALERARLRWGEAKTG
jgi:hypothetical protein